MIEEKYKLAYACTLQYHFSTLNVCRILIKEKRFRTCKVLLDLLEHNILVLEEALK